MKPLAWSHSALQAFDTCPRQYEEVKVLKHFQETKNEASLWGDEVHRALEKHIGAGVPLPANMSLYAAYAQGFIDRAGRTLVERRYALNKQLQPTEFFAKDVWCRAIIDVLTIDGDVAWVDDHKTGKNRKKDMQQLIVFALTVFHCHPEVNTVHCAFHWLQYGFDESAKDRETFTRAQMEEMWDSLVPKLRDYLKAFKCGIFVAKPSGLCRKHCPVTSCEYHGRGAR